ncbi:MAG: hypothetical protein QG623_512 [Patescibacteria group bacterium]|nr:hypothetical protein [Patescibacteria group bacterium]
MFDLMRGYFLFVIIIDHLLRFFGFWEIFTGRGAQWVSAAEGFFFLSGIMIGIVRGRRMIRTSLIDVAKKCWRQAVTLYIWGIGLSLLFSALAIILMGNAGVKQPVFIGSNTELIVQTLSLSFNYGWADFLIYYAVYLFSTPLAIWLLRNKLWHSVLLISLIVWMQTTTIMGSWQILFFSGLVVGFYKDQIEDYFLELNNVWKKSFSSAIYALSAVTLLASVYFTTIAEEYGKVGSGNKLLGANLESSREYAVESLRVTFDRASLAPLRLLLFYLWFAALYLLFRKYQAWMTKRLGWILLTFGQNSLYVYIVHALLIFALNLIVPIGQHWVINVLINTGFVLLVWLMVRSRFLFRFIPR